MSYRDLRNFSEMMRALGYPNQISMESFRTPNFPLIANILLALTKRFDPDVEISPEIATESDRVKLIRSTAEFMAIKANIKLNTKRLYQADGYSVKELLKIISLLHDALNSNINNSNSDNENDDNDEEGDLNGKDFDIVDKVNELKLSRQLASEITTTGASLFDLLGKEVNLRSARYKSVARQYELTDIEKGIKGAVDALKSEITTTKDQIQNIASNEAALDAKIERRKTEIERYEKRLQTLKKVRPAFLEEFTQLEKELEGLFVQFSLKTRILNHFEQLVAEAERQQHEKQLLVATPRIETIPLDNSDQFEVDEDEKRFGNRPRAGTGGGRVKTGKKVFGGMQPPMSATPSIDSDESDELFIDKDESELLQSEEDDDDESLELDLESEIGGTAPRGSKMRVPSSKPIDNNSDDDF